MSFFVDSSHYLNKNEAGSSSRIHFGCGAILFCHSCKVIYLKRHFKRHKGKYWQRYPLRPSGKIGQADPPLYPYVCQDDPQSKVDWKGMVWGITNTVIGMIEPLGPIAALSSIIQSIDVSKSQSKVN